MCLYLPLYVVGNQPHVPPPKEDVIRDSLVLSPRYILIYFSHSSFQHLDYYILDAINCFTGVLNYFYFHLKPNYNIISLTRLGFEP